MAGTDRACAPLTQLQWCDVSEAMRSVLPSYRHSPLAVKVKATSWDDIGGMDEIKEKLQQLVLWPLQHPDTFARFNLPVCSGLLLYGPPGCAKTSLVRALACSARTSFVSLNGAELYSSFLGEAEAMIRAVFKQARASVPAIIFIDEIDVIVGKRDGDGGTTSDGGVQERVLAMLLNEMDGMEGAQGVIVIGATNRRDMIDSALLRPGRLGTHLCIPLPDR